MSSHEYLDTNPPKPTFSRRRFLASAAAGAAVLLVAAYGSKQTEALASGTGEMTMAAPMAAPALAASGPKAYIGLFKDNAVAVFDTGTNTVLGTIPIPTGPHGLVVTPDGMTVYASSDGASTVSIIDTMSDTVSGSIEVGMAPHGLAITPDGKQVLVAGFGTNQVLFIDVATNKVINQIAVPQPHNIAISPDGRTAYVASQQSGMTALAILSISDQAQIGSVPLDKTPRAIGFTPDGKQVYFTLAGSDALQVLDPATNKIVTQIPVGASPHHPLITATGEYGLIVVQGPGTLGIFDPMTNQVTGSVKVGMMPHWIASSADGDTAWVTNENSNDVTVVDVEKQSVIATVPVGNAPRKIVMQPDLSAMANAGMTNAGAATGAQSVTISGFTFMPATINVAPGQMVTWTNMDSVSHTVTSDKNGWDSKTLMPGATFSHTFDQAGTDSYHCAIHPFMTGKVVVGS